MNRFTQCIVATFVALPLFVAQAQPAGTIILDNREAVLSGTGWTTKSNAKGQYGPDYGFASTAEKEDLRCLAMYKPKLPAAGTYNVEIMYPAGDNRYTASEWTVVYEGGQVTVPVNQKSNGGEWVTLVKQKPFAAGNAGYVLLSNKGTPGSVVIADAVRFVPAAPAATTAGGAAPAGGSGKTYSLTVNAGPGGTVSTTPSGSTFSDGSTVYVMPKANDGYVFDGWSGDAKGFKNPLKLTISKHTTLMANFIPAGIGVIMDNRAAEFRPDWKLSQTNWGGARYEDYHFASSKAKADYFAHYRPNIPKSGKYDVYIWYATGSNRSTKAPWIVHYRGGKTTAVINQQERGGEWVPIAASVPFDAGKNEDQYVEVNNGTGESDGGMVIADAVALVYVGD